MSLGIAHPENPTLKCEISRDNHPKCTAFDPVRDDYIDWDNPDHVPTKKVVKPKTRMREMAGRVAPAPTVGPVEGFAAGVEGSQRAASRWDDAQRALVDAAIRAVAERHRGGQEFTTDAIWAELGGRVPVTKGLTARMMVAVRAGLVDLTGKVTISERGGHHDHGQRLSIWYSLLPSA